MKKYLLLVVAAMMATVSVNAQEELKNEISIAYGAGSNTDILGSIGKGMFTGKQLSYWGPVSAEYFHRPSPRFGVGAVAAIGGCDWDDTGDAKTTFITFMPAVKYNWVNKSSFGLYSKVAAGITFRSESGGTKVTTKDNDSSSTFNFQITGIGLEFGRAFRGFAELGMGEQGIILAGLRYKF